MFPIGSSKSAGTNLKRRARLIRFPKAMAVGVLALVLVLGGSVSSQAGPAPEAAVHAADDAWVKAYNSGQLENVVALYDENAVVYPPGAAPLSGKSAIHEYFAKDVPGFPATGLTFALGANPAGGVSGNMGWASGTWTVQDKSGKVVDSGWYFSVSKKVNGKWLYVRDTWNSNGPAAPAATTEK